MRVLTSLNQLDGNEEYVFIGHWSDAGWLKPLLGERQILVQAPRPAPPAPPKFEKTKKILKPFLPLIRRVKNLLHPPPETNFAVPFSDGFIESLNCDVVHFPYQDFIISKIPGIYNPHDLQHLHFPDFFSPPEIKRRETIYRAACRQARTVVTASKFVKEDIVKNYQIGAEKIQVIPWSPPELISEQTSEKEFSALCDKYGLPSKIYALYPAMTWEHKNHLRLLEAAAQLRDRDNIEINLVCTGYKNSFYPQIERRLQKLNLEKQIIFTDLIPREELNIFYENALFVIIPTLFEAASAPLFEAWQHRAAVACSAVTSLPEQASGAAYLFDPHSVDAIAEALKVLSGDKNLRNEFRRRGIERLTDFSLEKTLKSYRAVYRQTAGVDLTPDELSLLSNE